MAFAHGFFDGSNVTVTPDEPRTRDDVVRVSIDVKFPNLLGFCLLGDVWFLHDFSSLYRLFIHLKQCCVILANN